MMMVHFVKKYKWEILLMVLLTAAYFSLRFFNLMKLPLFTDEAIYARWAQIASRDAAWRFISLTDGKQPLYIWFIIGVMKFVANPLAAGRLVSVGAGFMTTIGLFFAGREIFKNRWIGLLAATLYVFYPFGLVYDRMTLYDSFVAMFCVWSLYLEFLFVRKNRLDLAMILALVLGGGMLTKTSAFFFAAFIPTMLLVFDFGQKNAIKKVAEFALYSIVAVMLAYLYYSVLRLSPFFNIIEEKNSIFVYPFKEWLQHPFTFFIGNWKGLWDWLFTYIKLPLMLVMVSSFFYTRTYWRQKLILLIWFIVPFLYLAFFGRILYPRFILFMTMPLLLLGAYGLYRLVGLVKQPLFKIGIVILVLLASIHADYGIITDFARAPIPKADLSQYINDWPAGGGLKQVLAYLAEQSKDQQILAATEGTFGSLPTYAVEIYLGDNGNVHRFAIWPLPRVIPKELTEALKTMPVYMIFNQTQTPPEKEWHLKLIAKYQKGVGDSYLRLYQVMPQE